MAVLYIAGAMRSGTTIAGQVLAASPSGLLIGEVIPVLREPERHGQCDCGHPLGECPFWSKVYLRPPTELVAAGQTAYTSRVLPRLLLALLTGRIPDDVAPVVDHLRAVAAVAGDRIVLDTSKAPVGIVLWRLAGQRVHVVLCVRDPREVAAAQARPTEQTGLRSVPEPLTYAVWLSYNAMSIALGGLAETRSMVRYRRLRNEPLVVARRLWRRVGAVEVPNTGDPADFVFGETHVLAGNPRRAHDGRVHIEPLPPRVAWPARFHRRRATARS